MGAFRGDWLLSPSGRGAGGEGKSFQNEFPSSPDPFSRREKGRTGEHPFSRALPLAVAASLALGAAACDALLGLGDYQSAACVGSDCHDASSDGTGVEGAPNGDDASSDASAVPPLDAPYDGPSQHELWAHWPMPNPDASVGGDSSAPLPNPMSYEAGAPGTSTVSDLVTHLAWDTAGSATAMSFDDAAARCATFGMRLPTRIELVSIIDFTQQPTIDSATFPGTAPSRYWTESVVAHDAGAPDAAVPHWTVDFSDGLVHNDSIMQAYVRCVSGGDAQ